MENPKFDKTIIWDAAHKYCKLYEKKDKNGNTYYMGALNNNCQLTMRKTMGQYAKDGEWELNIIPIKYTKAQGGQQSYSPQQVANEIAKQPDLAPDEVPF